MANHPYNCIIFDEIAEDYERTRPFLSDANKSNCLQKIAQHAIEKTNKTGECIIADVGCGTGRLTVPLSNILKSQPEGWPKGLKLYAYDISDRMLELLRSSIDPVLIENEHVVVKNTDLRELLNLQSGKLDIIICHWIFHVISDWRIAALNVHRIAKSEALLFLCHEESPFYQAIDGDTSHMPGGMFKQVVDDYARILRDNRLYSEKKIVDRLGSRVSDDGIAWLFKALGWTESSDRDEAQDSWTISFSPAEFIQIIEKRLFTNLRYFPKSENLASDIARKINKKYGSYGKRLNSQQSFPVKFYYEKLHRPKKESERFRDSMLQLLEGNFGSPYERYQTVNFNEMQLWELAFITYWDVLNSKLDNEGGYRPLKAVLADTKTDTHQFFFARTPFLKNTQYLSTGGSRFRFNSDEFTEIWDGLLGDSSGRRPVIFHRTKNTNNRGPRVKILQDWYDGWRVFPLPKVLIVKERLLDDILSCKKDGDYFDETKLSDLLKSNDDAKKLIKAAKSHGIGIAGAGSGIWEIDFLENIAKVFRGQLQDVALFPCGEKAVDNRALKYGLAFGQTVNITPDQLNMVFELGRALISTFIDEYSNHRLL